MVQMTSIDNIETNLENILRIIEDIIASGEKVSLIIFPENSLYFRVGMSEPVVALNLESKVWDELKARAKRHNVNLHLTTAVKDRDQKTYNASVLIRATGTLEILYRKVHLFDIELAGQKPIRESDAFGSGDKPKIFTVNGVRFGSSICYDIRFSELYVAYAKEEIDAILVPAAFLVQTGQAHWEILLRARAIESQCYVLAPAQVGIHQSEHLAEKRETYGHTMAVGPWGDVIHVKKEDVGFVIVEINQQAIHSVRAQIPMKSHRRL